MTLTIKKQTHNSYKVFDSKEELKGYLLSKGDGKKKWCYFQIILIIESL